MKRATMLVSEEHQTAEVAMRTVALSLQLKGESHDGAEVIDALADAIARAIFETVRDPNEALVVAEIAAFVKSRIIEGVREAVVGARRLVS